MPSFLNDSGAKSESAGYAGSVYPCTSSEFNKVPIFVTDDLLKSEEAIKKILPKAA